MRRLFLMGVVSGRLPRHSATRAHEGQSARGLRLLCVLAAVLLVAAKSTSASAAFILIADDYLASNPGFTGDHAQGFPEDPPGPNYYWSNGGSGITNDFTWDMSATRDEGTEALSAFVPGPYAIELSWGAWPGHQTSVSYTLDIDGFGNGSDTLGVDQFSLATGVDHSKLANGDSVTGGYWSDFLAVGAFNMPSASEIFMDAAPGNGGASTVVVLRLTAIPEPSSIVLAVIGLVALAFFSRRTGTPNRPPLDIGSSVPRSREAVK